MKKFTVLITFASLSLFADPGIMIDIDIFIEHPTGKPEVEIACN